MDKILVFTLGWVGICVFVTLYALAAFRLRRIRNPRLQHAASFAMIWGPVAVVIGAYTYHVLTMSSR